MQNSKRTLVCGVGTNDADYFTQKYETTKGKQKRTWICPYYKVWMSMIVRCYSKNYQNRFQTYTNCSVDPEWLTFSNFKAWMMNQEWKGLHLDKDVLVQGNKIYAPSKCIFISAGLNKFMIDSASSRGNCPLGVDLRNNYKKFRAGCSNPFTGNREHLGYFSTPGEAHQVWKNRKHELALIYADMQADERIAAALRSRYSKC